MSILLEQPKSEIEGFLPFCEIHDEDENKEPRFTITFSTKKNLNKMKDDLVLQTDATYRLKWMGFPVFVVGNTIHISQLWDLILGNYNDAIITQS